MENLPPRASPAALKSNKLTLGDNVGSNHLTGPARNAKYSQTHTLTVVIMWDVLTFPGNR